MPSLLKGMVFSFVDRRDASRRDDDITRSNPGLKEKDASRKESDNKGLFNEDPLEEKRAIEETSEDRLSEAE